MAVYHALLQPGDTLMGMSLASGGHLTHGHKVNFSGIVYNTVQYGLNRDTEQLDYDSIEQLALEHTPKLIIAGASAYSKTIDFARFAQIAKKVDAKLLVDMAHIAGLVATGIHPSPVPYADCVSSTTHKTLRGPRSGFVMCKSEHAAALDRAVMPGMQGGPFMHVIAAKAVAFKLAQTEQFKTYQKQTVANAQLMAQKLIALGYKIVSGGTDNHLFIVDLSTKNVTGLQAEKALAAAGISVSRSCTPFDTQKPWITSGIRIGTPAITTRGMQAEEIELIVELIDSAITQRDNLQKLATIKEKVDGLCKKFPIYA
jgi:glycine hydroxymethyltransferase